MTDEKLRDSIKYCMVKKNSHNEKQAAQKIANALYSCDADNESLQHCRLLLSILIGD